METAPDALSGDAQSAGVRAAKEITFGSVAGMVSKVFEHPFDLTKVRLQAQVLDASARFNGPIDCLVKTWKNEGVRGLYRGLPAPVIGAMAENASLFLSYSELQKIIRRLNHQPLSEKLSLPQLALAGAGAGAITSFVLTPIELIKCKMQVHMLSIPISSPSAAGLASTATVSPRQLLGGPFAVLASVLRETGVRGLWLGQTGTLIRETGGTAAWFGTKELVASLLVSRRTKSISKDFPPNSKPELKMWESALAGACAGAAFNVSLFPADTVKSTMQTEEELRPQGRNGNATRPTFWKTARDIWRAQGVRGLYAGMGITVARSIPSSAMIFLIYDGLDRRFG